MFLLPCLTSFTASLSSPQVEMLILAIFENLPLREQLLAELKDDTQEEDWGW